MAIRNNYTPTGYVPTSTLSVPTSTGDPTTSATVSGSAAAPTGTSGVATRGNTTYTAQAPRTSLAASAPTGTNSTSVSNDPTGTPTSTSGTITKRDDGVFVKNNGGESLYSYSANGPWFSKDPAVYGADAMTADAPTSSNNVTGSNNPTGSKDPTSSNTTTAYGMTFYVDKDGYIYTDKECTNYIALDQADLEAWCRQNKTDEVKAYKLANLPTVTPEYKSWDDLDRHLDTLSTFRGTKTFTYKQGDYVYSCKVYWLNDLTGQKYSGNSTGGAYRMYMEPSKEPIGKSI